jgi:MFS family permease
VERATVERSLDASIRDGAAYAVMVGLGESWIGLCAVFLQATTAQVGLLHTIPLFLGACAQILSLYLIERTGRRNFAFVAGSFVQTLSWLPMIAALFVPKAAGFWILFGGFVVYLAANHFTMPAWMSVMGDLVPAGSRGRYFGSRNSMAFLTQTVALVLAGVGLRIYEKNGHEAQGFLVLFGGALLARAASTWYLSRMAEPAYHETEEHRFTLWKFVSAMPRSNFARFALFVACLNAAAHFAGALFVPYWRRDLGYGYWEILAVLAAVLVIQVPALVFWGRAADRFGNKKVLVATSLGISALPAMWLLTGHIGWAVFMQLWSGFLWSGFNQSVANFLLDAVSPPKRARCWAYLNFMLNTGVLVGGLAGSWAITVVPMNVGPVVFAFPFCTLLVLSTALRASVVFIFLRLFREVRDVPQVGVGEMLLQSTLEVTESAVNMVTGLVSRDNGKDDPVDSGKGIG